MQTLHHSKSKGKHPPLCPKSPKASTIQLQRQPSSRITLTKKNQRASEVLPPIPSTRESSRQGQPPLPRPRPSAPVQSNTKKEEVRQSEYKQYTRKNYLRRVRQKGESDLTDKLAVGNLSSQNSIRQKSKSALEYAKYFIKQVSSSPTDNSSVQPLGISNDQENINPNDPPLLQRSISSNKNIQSQRQYSRRKQRDSIMEKLKSLRSYRNRSKSKEQRSIQRQMMLSIEKRSIQKSTNKSKQGSSRQLGSKDTLIGRLKARRNKKVVLKVRIINQTSPNPVQESMNLLLNSFNDRSQSDRTQTAQKIELHLQILNMLPSYVKQFKEIYEEVDCWDQLLFLTYKKFYLQRLKVLQSLQSTYCTYSPFKLPFCQVSVIELRNFNPSIQGLRMQEKVKQQNKKIENALRQLYNHMIEKSGRYINMLEQDIFSQEIYYLIGEQVRLLGQSEEEVSPIRRGRMLLSIKSCYLMAFLNSQNVDIERILTQNELNNEELTKFEHFLNQKAE